MLPSDPGPALTCNTSTSPHVCAFSSLFPTSALSGQLALALTRSKSHLCLSSHIGPLFSPLCFSPCIFNQGPRPPQKLILQYQSCKPFSLMLTLVLPSAVGLWNYLSDSDIAWALSSRRVHLQAPRPSKRCHIWIEFLWHRYHHLPLPGHQHQKPSKTKFQTAKLQDGCWYVRTEG